MVKSIATAAVAVITFAACSGGASSVPTPQATPALTSESSFRYVGDVLSRPTITVAVGATGGDQLYQPGLVAADGVAWFEAVGAANGALIRGTVCQGVATITLSLLSGSAGGGTSASPALENVTISATGVAPGTCTIPVVVDDVGTTTPLTVTVAP